MKLLYIPFSEIVRIVGKIKNPYDSSTVLADIFRINTLYMIEKAGSGHIGSSFSSMDIITWLWTQEMQNPNENKKKSDIYFSSKGHDVPALYNILIGTGKLKFDYIHKLRRLNGLPGHPDISTPYIVTNTGSLGMGISKAMGMAWANRLEKRPVRIFVMCGDGELQEGAFWESLQPAVNGKFGEITVIIDHNKIQSDTWVSKVSDLGELEAKLKSFGWEVARCNGHDFKKLAEVFRRFKKVKSKPKILIADTKKGKGVAFMEKVASDGMYKFHSGAPSFETWQKALKVLAGRVNRKLKSMNLDTLAFDEVGYEPKPVLNNPQNLIRAYRDEIVRISKTREDIVVLDADLVLDTGLIPFRSKFPDRFVECGIAEQHMVSVAGGLALQGKLPIVHSFASFLSTRPNEQIYNNATEKTKIIYVGSLAGLLPGGPGHSHQSVRDISTLGSIPGITMIEPCNEVETRMAIKWAVNNNRESTYIRLVSIPIEMQFDLPGNYQLKPGSGIEIIKGNYVAIVAYGPVMLCEVVKAVEVLSTRGIKAAVINLPWLNKIDEKWLNSLRKYKTIVTIDDHYTNLGQGTLLASKIAKGNLAVKVVSLGVNSIPECGQNQEVLLNHGLDYIALAKTIQASL